MDAFWTTLLSPVLAALLIVIADYHRARSAAVVVPNAPPFRFGWIAAGLSVLVAAMNGLIFASADWRYGFAVAAILHAVIYDVGAYIRTLVEQPPFDGKSPEFDWHLLGSRVMAAVVVVVLQIMGQEAVNPIPV